MTFNSIKELEKYITLLRVTYVINNINSYKRFNDVDINSLSTEDLLAIYACLEVKEKK